MKKNVRSGVSCKDNWEGERRKKGERKRVQNK